MSLTPAPFLSFSGLRSASDLTRTGPSVDAGLWSPAVSSGDFLTWPTARALPGLILSPIICLPTSTFGLTVGGRPRSERHQNPRGSEQHGNRAIPRGQSHRHRLTRLHGSHHRPTCGGRRPITQRVPFPTEPDLILAYHLSSQRVQTTTRQHETTVGPH
jgi:hypothetical protein